MSSLNERPLQIFAVFLIWISFFAVHFLWKPEVHPVLYWGVFALVTLYLLVLIFLYVVQKKLREDLLAGLGDSAADQVTRLLIHEMPDDAVKYGAEELAGRPDDAHLRLNLAQAHLLLGQKREAKEVFEPLDPSLLPDPQRDTYERMKRRLTS